MPNSIDTNSPHPNRHRTDRDPPLRLSPRCVSRCRYLWDNCGFESCWLVSVNSWLLLGSLRHLQTHNFIQNQLFVYFNIILLHSYTNVTPAKIFWEGHKLEYTQIHSKYFDCGWSSLNLSSNFKVRDIDLQYTSHMEVVEWPNYGYFWNIKVQLTAILRVGDTTRPVALTRWRGKKATVAVAKRVWLGLGKWCYYAL